MTTPSAARHGVPTRIATIGPHWFTATFISGTRWKHRTGSSSLTLDGLLAEPEYDLGIIMREDPLDLLDNDPRERARWLAAHTGLDAVSIWEWGVVERVSTGLLGTKVGLQPVSRQMLAAADHVAL